MDGDIVDCEKHSNVYSLEAVSLHALASCISLFTGTQRGHKAKQSVVTHGCKASRLVFRFFVSVLSRS